MTMERFEDQSTHSAQHPLRTVRMRSTARRHSALCVLQEQTYMYLDAKAGEVYENKLADLLGLSDNWEFLVAPWFIALFTPFALVVAYQTYVLVPALAERLGA